MKVKNIPLEGAEKGYKYEILRSDLADDVILENMFHFIFGSCENFQFFLVHGFTKNNTAFFQKIFKK
jgi:hypothetical protein